MKIKTLSRSDWSRILVREQTYIPVECEGFKGYAALLVMKSVTAPLSVPVLGQNLIIADEGFSWIQIAPAGEHWWLTVMFDAEGRIVQYYFDVSRQNHIDGENSWFEDLYLDVVLLPDGRIALLDEDELDEAFEEGIIAADEHELAFQTADALMKSIPEARGKLEAFCSGMQALLFRQLCDTGNV